MICTMIFMEFATNVPFVDKNRNFAVIHVPEDSGLKNVRGSELIMFDNPSKSYRRSMLDNL
jgi:hypothetical protein